LKELLSIVMLRFDVETKSPVEQLLKTTSICAWSANFPQMKLEPTSREER